MIFVRLCGTPDTLGKNDSGDVEYRVTSARCTRTFVNGLPSNQSPIVEVDTVIHAHMKPIPPTP